MAISVVYHYKYFLKSREFFLLGQYVGMSIAQGEMVCCS